VDTSETDVDATLRRLRRFHEGLLRTDDLVERVRFVTDPATGRLFLPVKPYIFESGSVTLHIPDDADDALHVAVVPVPADPDRDAGCDRYLIYFGRAEQARWAALDIESVKHVDLVLDGPEAQHPNPLRSIEARACKKLNAAPHLIASLCRRRVGVECENPLLVGIDPFGLDIRARFGIIRLEFDAKAKAPEEFANTLRALIGEDLELLP